MALFAANALPPSQFRAPAQRAGFGAALSNAFFFGPVNFLRNVAQGACAGLLTFLGAAHLVEGAAIENPGLFDNAALNPNSLEVLFERALAGGAPGVVEILGAAALFLSAGRGPARLLGLLGFVAIAVAHANGVDHSELLPTLESIIANAQSFIAAFETVNASG